MMRMPRLSLGRRKQRLPLQLVPAPCSQQRRPPLAPYSLPLLSSWARRWSAGPTGSGESRCVSMLQDTRAHMLVACVRALTYAYDHGHASHVLACHRASLCALTRPRLSAALLVLRTGWLRGQSHSGDRRCAGNETDGLGQTAVANGGAGPPSRISDQSDVNNITSLISLIYHAKAHTQPDSHW